MNPFPSPLNPPSTAYFPQYSSQFLASPDMRNPYMQSWNLTVERQIIGNFVVRGSYVGSKGTNLVSIRELNPAVYAPGVTTATTNQRRPYAPGLGSTSIVEPGGNSNFNAVQVTAERRFREGLLDSGELSVRQEHRRGVCQQRHWPERLRSFQSPLRPGPFRFRSQTGIQLLRSLGTADPFPEPSVNSLLGGWNLNGIVSLMSGPPFTVTSGVDNARNGTGSQRAILVGDPYITGDRSRQDMIAQYLNKAAFAAEPDRHYGYARA